MIVSAYTNNAWGPIKFTFKIAYLINSPNVGYNKTEVFKVCMYIFSVGVCKQVGRLAGWQACVLCVGRRRTLRLCASRSNTRAGAAPRQRRR